MKSLPPRNIRSLSPLALIEPLEARIAPAAFLVNSLNDGAPAKDGKLTLREAILAANTNAPVGDARAGDLFFDTIRFAPALAERTIALAQAQGELTIAGGGALQITGPAGGIAISGEDVVRVVHVLSTADSVTLANVTITKGKVTGMEDGGGLRNEGPDTTLTGVTVTQNNADGSGGGVSNSGTIEITDSVISNNTSSSGSGIFNSNTGKLTLTRTLVTGNSGGGGILSFGAAFIERCTVTSNTEAGFGGGMYFQGMSTVLDTTVAGNTATDGGAGITFSGGMHTIDRCTISGNTGGGILSSGSMFSGDSVLRVLNSTIASNVGDAGIVVLDHTVVTIVNSTIVGNSNTANGATASGGIAVFTNLTNTVALFNSIVAQNAATFAGADDNVTVGGLDTSASNFIGGNPMLGALQDNGGTTATMLPLAGSPVIDTGSNAAATNTGLNTGIPLLTDGRGAGFTRIVDGNASGFATVDIGAAEFTPATVQAVSTFSFTQAGGAIVRVALTGGGTFDLGRDGDDIEFIHTTGTTVRSTLSVKVLTPGGAVDVGAIHADTSLKGIALGPGTTLTGGIGVDGALASLALADGASASIRTGGTAKQKLAFKTNSDFSGTIDTTSSVTKIVMPKFNFNGSIRAAAIGGIAAKSMNGATANDPFDVGSNSRADLIATSGGIGPLKTTGTIASFDIIATHSMAGVAGIFAVVKNAASAVGVNGLNVLATRIGKISAVVSSATTGDATLNGIGTSTFEATAGPIAGASAVLNFLNPGARSGSAIVNVALDAAGTIGPIVAKSAQEPALGRIANLFATAGGALTGWAALPTAAAQSAALIQGSLGAVTASGDISGSTLSAGGNVGAITAAGAITSTRIIAGAAGDGVAFSAFLRPVAIASVKSGGTFSSNVVSAGINPTDGTFGNANDAAGAAGLLSTVSRIGVVSIGATIPTVAVNVGIGHTSAIQAGKIAKLVVGGTTIPTSPAIVLDLAGNGMDEAGDTLVRIL